MTGWASKYLINSVAEPNVIVRLIEYTPPLHVMLKCFTESRALTERVRAALFCSLARSRKQPSRPFCSSVALAWCRDSDPWNHLRWAKSSRMRVASVSCSVVPARSAAIDSVSSSSCVSWLDILSPVWRSGFSGAVPGRSGGGQQAHRRKIPRNPFDIDKRESQTQCQSAQDRRERRTAAEVSINKIDMTTSSREPRTKNQGRKARRLRAGSSSSTTVVTPVTSSSLLIFTQHGAWQQQQFLLLRYRRVRLDVHEAGGLDNEKNTIPLSTHKLLDGVHVGRGAGQRPPAQKLSLCVRLGDGGRQPVDASVRGAGLLAERQFAQTRENQVHVRQETLQRVHVVAS
eukprot:m.874228 g.874228  ORF g.874228 m.874228 type:complete len:344 (-) comp59796_c0_seq19:86-1117(-)